MNRNEYGNKKKKFRPAKCKILMRRQSVSQQKLKYCRYGIPVSTSDLISTYFNWIKGNFFLFDLNQNLKR